MKNMIGKVHSLPKFAYKYPYIVVRYINGELWYWSVWHTREQAEKAVSELKNGGAVIKNPALK